MQKKKIFLVNDASFLSTGYAIYGKEILTRLHKNPEFEVAELGCYADIKSVSDKNIPWKFYPNCVANNDTRIDEYKSNNINQFGQWRFNRCLADFRPHIVFDIRDYWMFSYQENSPFKKYFNWIIMPATDSAPPKLEWLYTYKNADLVVPYTEWAKKTLSTYCGKNINLFSKIANAGINPDEFYPIDNKDQHKNNFFGKNISVVGVVMRNQKRKLFPDLMIAYKRYLEQIKHFNIELYKNSYLYLHTSYPEESGWDIPSLLLEHELLDKTYLTYVCRNCKNFFPSKFHGSIQSCKICANGHATVCSASAGVSTQQLNQIYNFFDLFVQYAICEGFGMPQVEAAACGIPIVSVDYSAMTEIVDNLEGYKIPVDRVFREMETNADRVYPDIEYTTQVFYDFFVKESVESRRLKAQKTRSLCESQYTWDKVYSVWEECFNSIDIGSKVSWDSQQTVEPKHKTTKVPKDLNNTEFVQYICHNVVNNPDILNTAAIQCLIRDLNNGIVAKSGQTIVIDRNQAIKILENYLNNQINCEKMRLNSNNITKEDFIK
jgi:glycosyltransferase involved in cell wall biosynthesis